MKGTILIVDDSPVARIELQESLKPSGYELVVAKDGAEAWELLCDNPSKYTAVLLDRVMPKMDGMEVLKNIKKSDELKYMPVIMQTAKNAKHEILEGIQAGAYYYLTKPYTDGAVLAITKAAVTDFRKYKSLSEDSRKMVSSISSMDENHYTFHSLDEADIMSKLLSHRCADPDKVLIGLSELLTNAIEHGNLGITYQEKSDLINLGNWKEEVLRRLTLPEFSNKVVSVEVERAGGEISFLIKDNGEGFDWKPYLEISTERAFDTHGRGIAIANGMSFNSVQYMGKGNEVLVVTNE